MKKYGIIIDIINNFLAFWPGHYIHIGVISPIILSRPRLLVETAVVKIEKNITS